MECRRQLGYSLTKVQTCSCMLPTKSSSQLNDDTYYPFYTVKTPSSQCLRLLFMIQLITAAGEATAQGTSEPDGFESSKVQFFFFHIVVLKYHGKKVSEQQIIDEVKKNES